MIFSCMKVLSMIVNKDNNSCISYVNWSLRTGIANNRKKKNLTSSESNHFNFPYHNLGMLALLTP